jgi:hypothetical protein
MTLLSAFALLQRHSGQGQFRLGTPVADRRQPETEGLIGLFLNNRVLRADFRERPTFTRRLEPMRDTVLEAFRHQDVLTFRGARVDRALNDIGILHVRQHAATNGGSMRAGSPCFGWRPSR